MAERIPPDQLTEGVVSKVRRFLHGWSAEEEVISNKADEFRGTVKEVARKLQVDLKRLSGAPDDKEVMASTLTQLTHLKEFADGAARHLRYLRGEVKKPPKPPKPPKDEKPE